jgi:hypothetical protein
MEEEIAVIEKNNI